MKQLKSNIERAGLVNISWSCLFCHFHFMCNHHFYDLIQFKVSINVYMYIKVYRNAICSIFVNWNLIKQKHMVGHFSNIYLVQCRITKPPDQCCDCKGHDFHYNISPPPLARQEGLKWGYTRVGTSSHSAPVFLLQSSAWWSDCSPAEDLRNWEFRPIKAALMLSGMCHPFLGEPGVQQGSGTPDTASLALLCCCALRKGWQKDIKIELEMVTSWADWAFVLLALGLWVAPHFRSQEFWGKCTSAALLGTAGFKWACEPWSSMGTHHAQRVEEPGALCASLLSAWVLPRGCSCPGRMSSPHLCSLRWQHLVGWPLLLPLDKLQTTSAETINRLLTWDQHFSQKVRWSLSPFYICISPCGNHAEQGCVEAGIKLCWAAQPW